MPEIAVGGVQLSHMLIPEGELDMRAFNRRTVATDPRAEVEMKTFMPAAIHARTGNFPAYTQSEVFEQATINAEAQNRASIQRCRKADPNSQDQSGLVRQPGHYRQWADLDSLFSTMGPNPL